jgi:glycine/D-amino acid oxidase-like deaminating enzyme
MSRYHSGTAAGKDCSVDWREAKAFGEVEHAIHTPGVAVQHDEHRARGVFRPRDQKQEIGAEVEHGRNHKAGAEAIEQNRFYRREMVQFVQDRFPELKNADDSKVLAFLKARQ